MPNYQSLFFKKVDRATFTTLINPINPLIFDHLVISQIILDWQQKGGVLLMGYELYRQLANRKPRKQRRKKKDTGPECIDIEEEDKNKSILDGK